MFDYLLRASAVVNDLSFTHLHEPPRPNTGNPVPRGTPAIRQVRRPHSCSTQNSGMIVPFASGFGKRGILFIQPNVRVGVSVCVRVSADRPACPAYPPVQNDCGSGGKKLCRREGHPYSVHSKCPAQKVCCRQDHHKIAQQ